MVVAVGINTREEISQSLKKKGRCAAALHAPAAIALEINIRFGCESSNDMPSGWNRRMVQETTTFFRLVRELADA